MATSIVDMIHCALAVTRTPTSTAPAMMRNQTAPMTVTSRVLSAAFGSNSETVAAPAGGAPATMKMVAETTSAHPAKNPRIGCSARPTHEYAAPALTSARPRYENAHAMPSIGMPHQSKAAGPAIPAAAISTAVVAAIEYAGALPATAMTIEPAAVIPSARSS